MPMRPIHTARILTCWAAIICCLFAAPISTRANDGLSELSELDKVAVIVNGSIPVRYEIGDVVWITERVSDGVYRSRNDPPSAPGYREFIVQETRPCYYKFVSSLVDGDGNSYSRHGGFADLKSLEAISYRAVPGHSHIYRKVMVNEGLPYYWGDMLVMAALELDVINHLAAEFLENEC